MAEHDVAPLGERHPIHNWEYTDAAARIAATGFIPADVTKWAKQLDDGTYWELTDDSPVTWAQRTGAGGEAGYINIPQNSQSANYTGVLTDQAKHLFHPVGDNNPRTFTVPANSSVAYPVGTAITFVNKINVLTIAITSDTLTWAEDGSTGSRSLAANGIATALKITPTEWLISGTGLS